MRATHPSPAERAREYLEAHPAEHTSLDQLATVAGVSKFHPDSVSPWPALPSFLRTGAAPARLPVPLLCLPRWRVSPAAVHPSGSGFRCRPYVRCIGPALSLF